MSRRMPPYGLPASRAATFTRHVNRPPTSALSGSGGDGNGSKVSPCGSAHSASISRSWRSAGTFTSSRRPRSMSLVTRASASRRTSSAIPPFSTHFPGSAASMRVRIRSKRTRRRSRSRATPVAFDRLSSVARGPSAGPVASGRSPGLQLPDRSFEVESSPGVSGLGLFGQLA